MSGGILNVNKPQESYVKIALNTGGMWSIGAEQWLNHMQAATRQDQAIGSIIQDTESGAVLFVTEI